MIFAPFFAGAAGTGQCWYWQIYVDANDLWWQFGRFAEAVRGLDPPSEAFRPLLISHPRLRVYALVGKRTTVLWCRDKRNTWRSELAEGVPPQRITDMLLKLEPLDVPRDAQVRCYDPWSDKWSGVSVAAGAIRLPSFSRSIVARIETPPAD